MSTVYKGDFLQGFVHQMVVLFRGLLSLFLAQRSMVFAIRMIIWYLDK
jgi:hypothetical protein